ncbi:carbohydrate-binding module family 18 protein [Piromyces sp. E2]|nr:carbohydrate-binding module family 18 protein [Piromyces sp. E2]|eukprot:OUM65136.1 carbohydrate-binding module family 18 protein [Piromyces sp. E2]
MGNNLENIPKYIENFENLKELELNQNNITRIPNKFENMNNLSFLDLSDNKIKDKLPDSLNGLSKLHTVSFYNNVDIKGDVLSNPNLKVCRYCDINQNNCSSKDCYDDYLNLPISTDGRCGRGHARCPLGICCSKDGYCDSTYDQCFMSNGCQPKYGTCKKPCIICELDLTQNDFDFDENALPTSHNGRCGKGYGTKCPFNYCCSKEGVCTSNSEECKTHNGCQSNYGICVFAPGL